MGRVDDGRIDWFVLRDGCYDELHPGRDGVLRSEVFPGLWLAVGPLLAGDVETVLAVLDDGVATEAHAGFVAKLAESL